MENPDLKTILLKQAYDELKVICTKFQDESGVTGMEVTIFRGKLARALCKRFWLGSVIFTNFL